MSGTKRSGIATRRLVADRAGLAAVEFALVLPLYLTVAFAAILYGLYFMATIAVANAASEAARASQAGLSDTERQTLASAAATSAIQSYAPLLSLQSSTITSGAVTGNSGLFQVTVSYNFSSFGMGGLSRFVPTPSSAPTATVVVSHGGY